MDAIEALQRIEKICLAALYGEQSHRDALDEILDVYYKAEEDGLAALAKKEEE